MNKIIFISLIFIINWAPSGNYSGGDISPDNNKIVLINNNSGILDITSGEWKSINVNGIPLMPVQWERESEIIAFSLETDSGFLPVIYDLNIDEVFYGPIVSKIRGLNWDDYSNNLLVVTQNPMATIQCSIYVIAYSPLSDSIADSLTSNINVLNKFPARDGYFLENNLLCLAGNHLPPLRTETTKPYIYKNGFAFLLNLKGEFISKFKFIDDPSIWYINEMGQGVYACGNKVYYFEISQTGITKEILLSMQTNLINEKLPSAIDIKMGKTRIFVLWEIGAINCIGVYDVSDPSEEKMILCGVTKFNSNIYSDNILNLSGSIEQGIYNSDGDFLLSFTGNRNESTENEYYEQSEIYSISVKANSIEELFLLCEIVDKNTFSFLSRSISAVNQIRIFRKIQNNINYYQIHIGSFLSIDDAENYKEEVRNIMGVDVQVEVE